MESKANSTLGLLTSSTLAYSVALNGTLSSPLPVKAGVSQGSVLGPILFLIFINHLTDPLESPLYLFADDATLCRDISHPSDRWAAASSLASDLEKITNWSNTVLFMYPYCPPFASPFPSSLPASLV